MNRFVFVGVAAALLAGIPQAAQAADASAASTTTTPAATPAAAPAPAATPAAATTTTTPQSERGWMLAGTTLGIGKNSFAVQLGWPGIGLSFLHGAAERLDVGVEFGFAYGLEGVPAVSPGLRLNAVARLHLIDQGRFSFGVRASPGLVIYFPTLSVYEKYFEPVNFHGGNYTTFGLALPVEFIAGIVISHELCVNVVLAVPMALMFVPEFSFIFPVQGGAGVEYRLDNSFSLTLDTRLGASVFMDPSGGNPAWASFKVMMGIAYRF